jgi:imidazoleglycerol-phosphate dehydratase
VHAGEPERQITVVIGGSYSGSLTSHVFESIAHHAGLTLHVTLHGGRDPHHIAEAQYKALARAMRQAIEIDPRETGVPSTKGAL